jgi:hypothetical protein
MLIRTGGGKSIQIQSALENPVGMIHEIAHTRSIRAKAQRVGAVVTGTVAGDFLGEKIGRLAFVALLHMGRKGKEGEDRIGDIADPLSVIYVVQVVIQHHLKSVRGMLGVNNKSFFVLDKPDRHRILSLHRYILIM